MAKYQSTLTGPQMDAALAAMPDAEAYAKGTRNGQEVQEGDPTYHNNSKYYAQLAQSAFPESYATGAVRGDIDQSTQTEEWRAQARENLGITNPEWGTITGNISSQTDLTEVVSPLINQWDEQWESGGIDNDGNNYNINPHIRCKGYIPVKPNTDYYAQISAPYYLKVHFYDINKSHISASLFGRSIFTTPSNAYFIRIWGYSDAYGGTYNHDISINYPSTYTGYYPSALPKAKAHIGGLGNAIGMKGWNQLIKPTPYSLNNVTFSVSNGLYSFIGTSNGNGGRANHQTSNINIISGHKYIFYRVRMKGNIFPDCYLQNSNLAIYARLESNSDAMFTATESVSNAFVGMNTSVGLVYDSTMYLHLIDLTALFGAGNEPSSVEDFRAMFPADYYPYCSGAWADLLWENASPTSDFAAQTISVDLSKYSFVLAEFTRAGAYGDTHSVTTVIKKGKQGEMVAIESDVLAYRRVSVSEAGCSFEGGARINPYATKANTNGILIPLRLYGIR